MVGSSLNSGEIQREALGSGSRLAVMDLVTGEQHAIPSFSDGQNLTSILISPGSPSIAHAATIALRAYATFHTGEVVDVTTQAAWGSATPGNATIAPGGLATGVAAGTSLITATYQGISGSTTLTLT